jgi:hypothetical protein
MNKYSTYLTIKEMHIKTRSRFHASPVRMAIIKITKVNKCLPGCMGIRNPYTLLVRMEISTTSMDNSIEALQKTKKICCMFYQCYK